MSEFIRNRPSFSNKVAPLNEPSKILIGCNTNLGPISDKVSFGAVRFLVDDIDLLEEFKACKEASKSISDTSPVVLSTICS